MNGFAETNLEVGKNLEPRKEWAAPELKKVDVEEITASGGTYATDSFGNS
jgi:hypothetical protein